MAKDYQKILNGKYEDAIKNRTNYVIEDALYTDENLLAYARKIKVVTILMSGYDVITNRFFANEGRLSKSDYFNEFLSDQKTSSQNPFNYISMSTKYFNDIEEYYRFINGNIYENSCFFDYTFSKDFIKKHKIDLSRINFDHLINQTIDDYTDDEIKREIKKEYINKRIEWENEKLKKTKSIFQDAFNAENYEIFKKIINESNAKDKYYYDSFFKLIKNEDNNRLINYCFRIIFDIHGSNFIDWLNGLIIIFGPNKIVNYLDENKDDLFEAHCYLGKRAQALRTEEYRKAHILILNDENGALPYSQIKWGASIKFVTTSEEYVSEVQKYVKNNEILYKQEIDKENKRDRFESKPISTKSIKTIITKWLYNTGINYKLSVQIDYYQRKEKIGTRNITLNNFFDIVYFLKDDLSDLNLLDLEGLKNVSDLSKYNFTNSLLRGSVEQKLGREVEQYVEKYINTQTIPETNKNELEQLDNNSNIIKINSFKDDESDLNLYIYYISDLHLEHRLKNYGAITGIDAEYLVRKIARNLINGTRSGDIILIDGDVCHDPVLYSIFVDELHNRTSTSGSIMIFTMGNHEALDVLEDKKLMQAREQNIKNQLKKNNMYLLMDSLLYINSGGQICTISNDDLWKKKDAALKNKIKDAKVIIFGGSGLVGYTDLLDTHPETDIKNICPPGKEKEYDKFNQLYKKVYRVCRGKNLVVVTHTPKEYWSRNRKRDKGVIYVSGHTHINKYFICTDYQVYEDNQIGYYGCKTTYPKLKYFAINSDVDIFSDYKDGIYKISENDYINFMRGKNISMNLNRYYDNFLMLKREGYYLFLAQSATGRLYILNGGANKTLYSNDVNYFYDHMLEVINNINYAFNDYLNRQKEIAKEVKRFGGDGTIHGCIIDIDFYNHIYLNPLDGTLTPYFAENMSWRDIYPSVSLLLKDKCPRLYTRYQKTYDKEQYKEIGTTSKNEVEQLKHRDEGTYPYYYSRILKKIQKVEKNILTEWIEEKPLSGLREGTKRDIEEQDQRELIYKKK